MFRRTTRRDFLRQLAVTGAVAPWIANRALLGDEEPGALRHACFGMGGMGRADLGALSSHPAVKIVALCDVDDRPLQEAASAHPDARVYRDWRELLAKEELDSVNVSTPDHMHASIALEALKKGCHVYCQKPLCHDISEVRALTVEAASRPKQVTQMGIQIQSSFTYRRAVMMIQEGLIGKIEEVHSWCGKGWVGEKGKTECRPEKTDPVPDYLDWDLWLGTAPQRPYVENLYHPGNWRRWIDFGTGTQGDMACHIMDPVFSALELTYPDWVMSECSKPFEETYSPRNKVIHLFPRTPYSAGDTIKYVWYDSGMQPDIEDWPIPEGLPFQGSMFVGEKGFLLLPHIGAARLLPDAEFEETRAAFDEAHPFKDDNHYHRFVDAALGKGEATARFSYSGPLTETVLMGCIANRFPEEKLLWDTSKVRFTNNDEANKYLQRTYRKGWEVEGLGS